MMEEQLPILDEKWHECGTAPRSLCHDGKSFLLHPVVHLHIFRGNEILLQKRSMQKRIQPGKWDTCVGGHISAGETVATALQREAMEEIGVDASDAKLLTRYEFHSPVEHELINIHTVSVAPDFEISVSNDEVDEVRFWDIDEILKPENRDLFTPNFLLELQTYLVDLRR